MTVSERAEAIFTTGSLQAPEFASLVGNIATAITATAKAQAEAMGAQGSYAVNTSGLAYEPCAPMA